MLEARGVDGTVRFDGETVVIVFSGIIRFRHKIRRRSVEDIRIPVGDLVDVQFQPSSLMWNGFLRFVVKGAETTELPPDAKPVLAVKLALRDPNAVVFSRYQDRQFEALQAAVMEAMP